VLFNPWKLKTRKERSREQNRREGRSDVRYYFYYGKRKFTAVKVARQCPLVLLVKVGWRQR
jgi:hypothetical protein